MKSENNQIPKEVVITLTNPKNFLVKDVQPNNKYSSKIYLPLDWEGKKVYVILK